MEKLKSDLQRWSAIYLSLAGKINCVKKVLPRFLYLFQSITVFLPKSFFRSLDALLSSFIWGGKSSRLRKTLLERPRKGGGLALPNFRVYYWAANLQKIMYWFQAPDTGWCSEEAKLCNLSSLPALLTTKLPLSPSQFSSSPVVRSSLRIWIQFRQTFKLSGLSMPSPICNNHLFPAAKLNATDIQWDTFIDNIFPTFADFAKKTLITKPSFLRYLQNRHFIQTYNQSFPQLPERSNLGVILKTPLSLKSQISNLYNSIMLFISL
jgi:hypothetical protein